MDGAGRTTATIGAGFKTKRFAINAGGGVIFEGTTSNPGECNPSSTVSSRSGCNGDGIEHAPGTPERQGPDPIDPTLVADQQAEAPVNKGSFQSHYVLFMLGVSTWF
jgi:hypothetical protein